MSSLKWGCCLLVLLFLCACSTTAQISSDPQGKIGTADAPDKQAAKKNVKNGKSNGSSATVARNANGKTHEKAQGSARDSPAWIPRGRLPRIARPERSPEASRRDRPVKPDGNNGQDNGDSAIDEEVDEIVELLRLAQAYRDKGDMDNALKALDKAYEILLAEEEESSTVVRQKDDMRLLIARKILDIYTGKRAATIGKAERNPSHHERRRGKGDPELPDDREELLRALLRAVRLLSSHHEAAAAAGGSSGGAGMASPRGKRLPGPCPFQGPGPRTLAVHPVDGIQVRAQQGSRSSTSA